MRTSNTSIERARTLQTLHASGPILVLVNVWDVASAKRVAALPGCRAIATASHSIAASMGYPDGEHIPRDLMLDVTARIVAAVDVPVTADLEAGYGDVGDTIRRAIGVGVVGANIEDGMCPIDQAIANVEAAVCAAQAEGVPLVLNARTDAFLLGDEPVDVRLAEAVKRGRRFLDAGASCVFVPGRLDAATIAALVDGIGYRRVSVLGLPGVPSPAELESLGVARVSYGPRPHAAALDALESFAAPLLAC